MKAVGLGLCLAAFSMAGWTADLEVLVLDREGKPLADAVVVLETTVPGPRPVPKAEVTIAQEKMKFVPTVSLVHTSTKVKFTNLDRWDHHVRGGLSAPGGQYLDPNQGYAFRLSGRKAGAEPSSQQRVFTETGPHLLGCHLHGSMRGHLYVTDSPWAAVSAADGNAKLSQVPPGSARLRVWHGDELVETPVQTVVVAEGMAPVRVSTQVLPRRAKAAFQQPQDIY
ncbi:cupredoxin domain-containing protein [Inhella gelatinilytica]|uniref:Plastocyanin n=1 Tax=Inhella gelatinilytica TaxID=2795030 RepID=A0A931IW76_9BURK|nr:plastocyanin [Inhella gelatinilytica]MBH9553062.1 plastocyanin [Inhella gelatinilytica]